MSHFRSSCISPVFTTRHRYNRLVGCEKKPSLRCFNVLGKFDPVFVCPIHLHGISSTPTTCAVSGHFYQPSLRHARCRFRRRSEIPPEYRKNLLCHRRCHWYHPYRNRISPCTTIYRRTRTNGKHACGLSPKTRHQCSAMRRITHGERTSEKRRLAYAGS